MTRGQDHYREKILSDAYVRVFASTNTAMMTYPYLLGRPGSASPTLSEVCETYMMDSDIEDSSVTNEEVIRRSRDLDADVVAAADVLHDPEQTTENIIDMFSQLADVEYDPEVLVPLQPNPDDGIHHVEHYYHVVDELSDHGIDVLNHRLSVGGVKDWGGARQLDAIVGVRNAAGDDQFLHGLGFGSSRSWITVMREYPWLLDSIDMSSVVKDIVQARRLFRPRADRVEYEMPRGANSTVLTTMLREFVLYLMSYILGPHPRDSDVPTGVEDDGMIEVLKSHGLLSNDESEMANVTAD